MKAKPSKKVAGLIIRSRKSIAKDGVVTVSKGKTKKSRKNCKTAINSTILI